MLAANERELHEKETKMMELQETYETLLLQHKVLNVSIARIGVLEIATGALERAISVRPIGLVHCTHTCLRFENCSRYIRPSQTTLLSLLLVL